MHWERKEDDRKRKMAVSQHNYSLLRKLFSGWKVFVDYGSADAIKYLAIKLLLHLNL